MELLTRTLHNLRRLVGSNGWFCFGILIVVLTLELVGRRQATTDMHDLVAVGMLFGVGWLVWQKHALTPMPWVTALGNLLQRLRETVTRRHAIDIGIDLRGAPPLPNALPRSVVAVVCILFVLLGVLLLGIHSLPLAARAFLVNIWYLGYLVALVALWAALGAGTFMAFVVPWAMIHDACVTRAGAQGGRSQRVEGLALVAYFGSLIVARFYLPPWMPLLVCVLALLVNLATIAVPSNPDVKFIWRYRNDDPKVRAIPWGRWVTCEFTFMTLAALDLVFLSLGAMVLGDSAVDPGTVDVMPVTTYLGLLLSWLSAGALTALVVQTVLGRLRDPARPAPPRIHIQGAASAALRQAVERGIRQRGWKSVWNGAPAPTDVEVALVAEAVPVGEHGPTWPLRVTADELSDPETLRRLARRHEILMRRALTAGLERLFKLAASRSFRRGSGMWIAPHLWFIPGLSRDTPEDELDLERSTILSGVIGLPYHRVLPRSVRHHAYVMLRALQVDLIFVEDGVGFRRFRRVLRMLYELYDVYGGKRRADEVHFQGVPGVRVLIHDYQLDEPFKSETYPEPDYENLGRARILHVFKDRGEQEEPLETPQDFTNMPMPSAAM